MVQQEIKKQWGLKGINKMVEVELAYKDLFQVSDQVTGRSLLSVSFLWVH